MHASGEASSGSNLALYNRAGGIWFQRAGRMKKAAEAAFCREVEPGRSYFRRSFTTAEALAKSIRPG